MANSETHTTQRRTEPTILDMIYTHDFAIGALMTIQLYCPCHNLEEMKFEYCTVLKELGFPDDKVTYYLEHYLGKYNTEEEYKKDWGLM